MIRGSGGSFFTYEFQQVQKHSRVSTLRGLHSTMKINTQTDYDCHEIAIIQAESTDAVQSTCAAKGQQTKEKTFSPKSKQKTTAGDSPKL